MKELQPPVPRIGSRVVWVCILIFHKVILRDKLAFTEHSFRWWTTGLSYLWANLMVLALNMPVVAVFKLFGWFLVPRNETEVRKACHTKHKIYAAVGKFQVWIPRCNPKQDNFIILFLICSTIHIYLFIAFLWNCSFFFFNFLANIVIKKNASCIFFDNSF